MKKLGFFLLTILIISLTACEDNVSETVTFKVNEPVFMGVNEFRGSVKINTEAHELTGYGKIAYYNGYLYMSEPGKGIHIINNVDPKKPQIVGYIELLGNADLSIRNNLLYADSFIDLVWFDVTNPAQPLEAGRLENVFPEALPLVENNLGIDYELLYGGRPKDKVIVGWKEVDRTESVRNYREGGFFWRLFGGNSVDYGGKEFDTSIGGNSVNGSMSRFSIYRDYLYVVINNQMSIFDLSKTAPERATESVFVGWNVETIFSYKEQMYMGTPTGLVIFSVEEPLKPEYLSSITHVFGCDPVVVEDDIAYVTIHSGNSCGQNSNDLIIIDVKDPSKPKQLASYGMTKPKGLGIDNKILFVCDDGLKVYDATNPMTIMANELKHYPGMKGYDVTPFNNVLMMIAEDGIYQYDYADLEYIEELSFLAVRNDSDK